MHILLQGLMNRSGDKYINRPQRHKNVEIGTEATHFPEKEYINGIFIAVHAVNKNSSGINYKRPVTLFSGSLFLL